MSHPAVTVLMAVHNTQPFVEQAIDSVLQQTLADLELIVVDDGSTDDSWSIISAAAARDRRVMARRRPANGGASRALNDGLALGSGDYITRQDADDVSLPTRLAEQVAFLQREPKAAAVGTQASLVDGAGQRLSETAFPVTADEIERSLVESMCFVGPTVMVRRTAFEQAGLWFDEALSGTEDYDLCLRLAEVAPLRNLARPLYLYRQHAASVSHRQRHQQLARKAQAVEKAVRRRHGDNAPLSAWIDVARDYLRAAVVAHAARETEASRDSIRKALEFHPGLANDSALVERIVRRYLNSVPEDSRVGFAETLFADVLPRSRAMQSVRRHLVAELHLAAMFASGDGTGVVTGHLWPAIRSNPASLLNRGVLARLMKSAIGRGRGDAGGLRP